MFPRLCVWRCLQQHLRLCQNPQQGPEPTILRVCRQWGISTAVSGRLVAHMRVALWKRLFLCPPVVCRNVWPEVRPPPVGEHCEEGGSSRPADHEPATHKASVVWGWELPWICIREELLEAARETSCSWWKVGLDGWLVVSLLLLFFRLFGWTVTVTIVVGRAFFITAGKIPSLTENDRH